MQWHANRSHFCEKSSHGDKRALALPQNRFIVPELLLLPLLLAAAVLLRFAVEPPLDPLCSREN